MADRTEPTVQELLAQVEQHGFSCDGGPLGMSAAWRELKRRLEHERPQLYTVEDGWVELHSGTRFYYREPTLDMMHIGDVAEALSKTCRYGGHVHTFYSVVEHSCLMMRWARRWVKSDRRLLRTILMHDCTETWLPDVPRPLKYMMPEFRAFEHSLEPLAARKFDLIFPHPAIVKELDTRILCDERAQAMNPSGNEWGVDSLEPLGVELQFWTPEEARDNFLGDYEELAD